MSYGYALPREPLLGRMGRPEQQDPSGRPIEYGCVCVCGNRRPSKQEEALCEAPVGQRPSVGLQWAPTGSAIAVLHHQRRHPPPPSSLLLGRWLESHYGGRRPIIIALCCLAIISLARAQASSPIGRPLTTWALRPHTLSWLRRCRLCLPAAAAEDD